MKPRIGWKAGRIHLSAPWLAAAVFALPLTGATPPRPSPADYPVQSGGPEATVAAEFYGRSAPTSKSTIFTGHYIVVEVAVYPAPGRRVSVNPSEFRLFINGAKYGLLPQSGTSVAGSLKWYGYQRERGLNTDIGLGPVYIPSQPRQGPTFPGDPEGRDRTTPKVPVDGQPAGVTRTVEGSDSDDPSAALPALELEAGATLKPVSGLLYFYWEAHTKKLRNVELRWEPVWGQAPKAVLKLVARH